MNLDTRSWGVNILAMAFRQRPDRLIFRFRGWRISLVLLVLLGILFFVFYKQSGSPALGAAGIGQVLGQMPLVVRYLIVPLLLLGALASFLYNFRVALDPGRRRVHVHRGFDFLTRSVEGRFEDIASFAIQEQGILHPLKTAQTREKPMHAGWDVIMKGSPGSGLPDARLWRAARKEQALAVAGDLARLVGCEVIEVERVRGLGIGSFFDSRT